MALIHLNSSDLTEDVARSLANPPLNVLLLEAATTSHSVGLIGTLTQCMDHLVHLRIVTTINFSEPPPGRDDAVSKVTLFSHFSHLSSQSYFINVSNALRSLPDLRTCEIWGNHWVSSKNDFHDTSEGTAVWELETFNRPDENHLDNLYSDFFNLDSNCLTQARVV
jgi:hypothetical protein